ncbi:hypothetical protein FX988_02810 [Paraglaciecola mesophila]|uniref:Uncharacterized protein n=1 Tax=Paraglaciecola mesophila TaxID=197222 RepID=A0A857JKY2_9ALTE|nr:hypothetical protein [Paraglaciecola mesophila]QHJ12553.1 hypothetical protein FX988_02810 [Paraglaciecola mesophila]
MADNRPLFKHIRNHDALFSELALLRGDYVTQLGLTNHEFHKTPKFITPDGRRLTIEPERSIVVPKVEILRGVKSQLEKRIPGFHIIPKSEIGFRYPTAAIAGSDAPFIKRFRSEFFHKDGENRDICRPINLSYGIKSRGKADNRQEYEVWVQDAHLAQDPSHLFIDKYGEDLPDEVRQFALDEPVVHGWMGVKRAAFEAIYYAPKRFGDIAVCVGLSVDAYNIGARPDLAYSAEIGGSIAKGNAELEWEVMGYYAPIGQDFEHDQIWHAIDSTIAAIAAPLENTYQNDLIATNESKTERILSTVAAVGSTPKQIAAWNLKPWEFLETTSEHRKKAHDPTRSVNLLGRLNRLFYQETQPLPSLNKIHDLIS